MTLAVSIAQSGANNVTMRNRIINGAMMIDQRNAGASATASTATYTFFTDRFKVYSSGASKLSGQRTTTAPSGFINSLVLTSLAATSPASGDEYQLYAPIEGYNIADLGWGTASAKTVTLSFWVRSSLTGTFSGCLYNPGGTPTVSYVFTYTISSADTWEYKTITISGDTSATWGSQNSSGITIVWDLGSGVNLNKTAGAWSSGFGSRTSGSVTLVGTNGATFYITGVQFEAGTTATAFEQRLYGTELALCQRYYLQLSGNGTSYAVGYQYAAAQVGAVINFPVTMRSGPTFAQGSGTNYFVFYRNSGATLFNSWTFANSNTNSAELYNNTITTTGGVYSGNLVFNNASAFIGFTAEL